jgi:hypothetical protein
MSFWSLSNFWRPCCCWCPFYCWLPYVYVRDVPVVTAAVDNGVASVLAVLLLAWSFCSCWLPYFCVRTCSCWRPYGEGILAVNYSSFTGSCRTPAIVLESLLLVFSPFCCCFCSWYVMLAFLLLLGCYYWRAVAGVPAINSISVTAGV